MLEAAAGGLDVAVHAIGDGANRAALNAFEATREQWEQALDPSPDRARPVPRRRRPADGLPSSA